MASVPTNGPGVVFALRQRLDRACWDQASEATDCHVIPINLRLSSLGNEVLRRYRGANAAARLFLNLRWRWTPYEEVAARLPVKGTILDLGSGHGLFSLALGLSGPERMIRGIDHEPQRVAMARQAAGNLANLRFSTGSLLDAVADPALAGTIAGIVIMDALHYLTPSQQETLLAHCRNALKPGGLMLIRDVDAGAGKTFLINRIYERAMTGIGFTRADRLNFRTRHEWLRLLSEAGFESATEACSRFPFADQLFVCRAPAARSMLAA